MYIAYILYWLICISPLIDLFVYDKKGEKNFVLTLTPLLMIDKKGEKYLSLYACFPSFIIKGGVVFMFMHICFVLQIGEKEFDLFYAC